MDNRIGLEIELLGFEQAQRRLADFQRTIRSFDGKKLQIDLTQGFKGLTRQKQQLQSMVKDIDYQLGKVRNKFERGELSKLEFDAKVKELKYDRGEITAAQRAIESQLIVTPRINWKAAFTRGKSIWGAAGTSLETIGNMFSNIGNNPLNTMFRGMAYSVGGMFTSAIQEGMANSITRFDTFRTFPKIMEQMFRDTMGQEKASKAASDAINYLNQNVLGLPTTLDEITSSAQNYIAAMGDIDKGSQLAVAANNAFLASFADENQKYLGQRQLQNISQGMELTKNQWNSLAKSMPNAMAEVGKSMGYKTGGEFLAALKDNQVTEAQFLDAFIKTGNSGGAIYDMAQEMSDTMTSAIARIQAAAGRFGEGIYTALDEALLGTTGKGLPATIGSFADQIDKITALAKDWIKNNPQVIKEWIDRIKSFDVVGFIKQYAKGVQDALGLLYGVLKWFGDAMNKIPFPKDGGIGWLLGFSGIGGRVITAIGQLVKGTSPLGGLLGVLATAAKNSGGFSAIGNFFGKFGKLGEAIRDAKVERATSHLEVAKASFKTAVQHLKTVATYAGIFLLVAGTITAVVGAVWAVGQMINSIGEMKIDWANAQMNLLGIGLVMTAIGTVGVAIQPIAGELVAGGLFLTAFTALATLDIYLIRKAAENIRKFVEEAKKINDILASFSWKQGNIGDLLIMGTDIIALADALTLANFGPFAPLVGALQKNTTGNLTQIVRNLKDTIKEMVQLSEIAKDVKAPSKASLSKIKELAEWMGDFYELFNNDTFDLSFLDGGAIGTKESENINSIVSSFNDIVTNIGTIVGTLDGMYDQLNALLGDHEGRSSKFDSIKTKLKDMTDGIGEIYASMKDAFDVLYPSNNTPTPNGQVRNGNTKKQSKEAGYIDDIVSSFTNTITAIKTIVETMNTMQQELFKLTTERRGSSNMDAIIQDIDQLTQGISDVYGKLMTTFSVLYEGNIKKGGKRAGYIDDIVHSFQSTLTGIQTIVSTFQAMQEPLDNLMNNRRGGDLTTIITRIQTLMEQLGTFGTELEDGEFAEVDWDDFKTKMDSMSRGVESIKDAMTQLIEAKASLEEMNIPGEGEFDFATKIRNIVTQLSSAMDGADGENLQAAAGKFSLAIGMIKLALSNLIGADTEGLMGVETALMNISEALDTVAEKMQTAGETWIQGLKAGLNMDEIKTHITTAFDSYSLYSQGKRAGSTFKEGFMSAVSNIHVTANVSADTSRAWAAINALNGASVGVSIAQKVAQRFARGGEVQYRAGGGIMFKRRGTDTVPAMLTPHEWVMRTSAVNKFGAPFMDRINNLDVTGAINALAVRFGGALGGQSRIVNNYNTNTNNAKVTQHITTNNPNWSYRRANRWVHAL